MASHSSSIRALGDRALSDREKAELITDNAIWFQQNFYLCTKEEMRRDWAKDDLGRESVKILYDHLPIHMQKTIDHNFADHNPLWEFTKMFVYDGSTFDPGTQELVPMAEYFLYPPLHKKEVQDKILTYLTTPQPLNVRGLAVFLGREFLKSYTVIASPSTWALTRHRIIFQDWTGACIIHDIEDEANLRTNDIKHVFTNCTPFKALYPEMALPANWQSASMWSLKDYDTGNRSRDPQIRAWGARSVKQGPHYLYHFLDDLESARHETSGASREETERFFDLLKYLGKGQYTKTILAGTFYSPFSIHAQIMDQAFESAREAEENPDKTGWIVIRLPAILDEGTPKERALYPTRQPIPYLRAIEQDEISKTGDNVRFRMNKMLDFTTVGKYTFDRDRWQTIDLDEPPIERKDLMDALPTAPIYVQADLAGKQDDTRGRGDWNAIWVMAYPRVDGRIFRVHLACSHDNTRTLDEGCAIALEMAQEWGAWYILAEESPSHRMVGTTLHRISMERSLRYYFRAEKQGKQVGNIRTIIPRGQQAVSIGKISTYKMSRMRKYQIAFNAGLILISDRIDPAILNSYQKEVFPFPFIGRDDLLDSACIPDDESLMGLMPDPRPPSGGKRRGQRNRREFIPISRYSGLVVRGKG